MKKVSTKALVFALGAVALTVSFYVLLSIPKRECGIHLCPMLKDTVYIYYGLIRPNQEYIEASANFTNANSEILGGCIVDESRNYRKIMYCPLCRDAEKSWLAGRTEKERAEIVQWVKEATSMNETNSEGQILIEVAVRSGDPKLIKEAIAKGGQVNSGTMGYPPIPLNIAIYNDDPMAVLLLIDAGANLFAIASDGSTPLHSAARRSSKEVVAVLMERGADLTAKDSQDRTPLDLARKYNKDPEVAKYLRQHRGAK